MTLKSGDVQEEKGNEVNSNSSVEELLKTVKALQEQYKNLKENNAITQGMSADDVAKIVRAVKDGEKEIAYGNGIKEEDIPLDDFDEKGVTFCAPFTGYGICDDIRKGHLVLLPYGKKVVFFEYQGTRRFQQGKYEQLAAFSAYMSHSKKEQEWLRKHTFFNTMFYESSNAAMSFDVAKAQKLARVMTVLKNFDLSQLISRAKEYGVQITQEVDVMRTNLAFKMVEREMESEQTSKQRMLTEAKKEYDLLLQKG